MSKDLLSILFEKCISDIYIEDNKKTNSPRVYVEYIDENVKEYFEDCLKYAQILAILIKDKRNADYYRRLLEIMKELKDSHNFLRYV